MSTPKPSTRDGTNVPELSTVAQQELLHLGLEVDVNNYVHWKKDNSAHPRNWTIKRKSYDFSLVIFLDFFTIVISTAGIVASEQARYQFHVSPTFSLFCFTTVYLLGQAFGGAILPPYSEAFGRKKLYIVATFLFCGFCIVVGAVPHIAAIVVGRFALGVLSAVAYVVAGSIEDMFNSGPRIWMVYIWIVSANLGLCAGPIIAVYITVKAGWQWIFYMAAIVSAILGCLMLGLRESRPSQLLVKRLQTLQQVTGNDSFRVQNPDHTPDVRTYMQLTLFRPLRLLFTEPIVFAVAVMTAVAFGLIYLLAEALPIVYGAFGFHATSSSLAFIAIGVGILLGIPILQPEDKLFGFGLAAPALALSLWWFAWTTPPRVLHVHWIASMFSLIFVGFAANEFDFVLAGYLADSYTIYAASAIAATAFVRAIFFGAFPLFARQLFTNLDANIGASILAAIATVFCVAPILFFYHGERFRKASDFAKHSFNVYNDNRVDADEWELNEHYRGCVN